MPAQPKRGNDCTPVKHAHGTVGHVVLRVDIHPELKNRLVDLAYDTSWSIKEHVAAALRSYLEEMGY